MKATRVTDTDEIMAVIAGFWQRDPVTVKWYFDAKGIDTTNQEDVAAKKDSLTSSARSHRRPHPLPLTVDLAWIWPVLLLLRPAAAARNAANFHHESSRILDRISVDS
jgi:hypothetical protein